jgi:PUA domain protein
MFDEMSEISRKTLRGKEAREILAKFAEQLKLDSTQLPRKGRFDLLSVEDFTIFSVDGKPFLVGRRERFVPALQNDHLVGRLPRVMVDMGAVPHVANGADIMAPGVRKVEGEFPASTVIAVTDEKFGKTLAVGVALMSSDDMRATKKGKVIENIHYVGDPAWNSTKPSG